MRLFLIVHQFAYPKLIEKLKSSQNQKQINSLQLKNNWDWIKNHSISKKIKK